MITLRKTKSLQCIAREWDSIASLRDEQVSSGKDHSANFVLGPAILNEVQKVTSLVDIGCGTGWLTQRAAKKAEFVVGIDPSEDSIAIAKERHKDAGIIYHASSVESYAIKGEKFDLAISNMSASSAPNLCTFILASREILREDSLFILTIPHPCFWPFYWGYATHPNFNYHESYAVEGEFKIQNEITQILTTHFHHPLEEYVNTLSESRFRIDEIKELEGRGFALPRFILIKARSF